MQWANAVGLEKNVTDREQIENRQRTDRETNYRVPTNHRLNGGLSGPITQTITAIIDITNTYITNNNFISINDNYNFITCTI